VEVYIASTYSYPVLKKVSDELYADVALPSARFPTGYVTGWLRAGLDVPATNNFFFLNGV
jgi:hypothetical protein